MIGPVGLMSVMSVMMALTMARTGSLSLCDEAVDGLMSRPPNTVVHLVFARLDLKSKTQKRGNDLQ